MAAILPAAAAAGGTAAAAGTAATVGSGVLASSAGIGAATAATALGTTSGVLASSAGMGSLAASGIMSSAGLGYAGLASAGAGIGLGSLMQYGSMGMNVLGTYGQMQAAKQQAALQAQGIKAQAFQESLQAEEQSIMRRERLIKALAAQNVAGGAAGAAGGSVEALQLQSMKEFTAEQQRADLMAKSRRLASESQAEGAIATGKTSASRSLISGLTTLAEIG